MIFWLRDPLTGSLIRVLLRLIFGPLADSLFPPQKVSDSPQILLLGPPSSGKTTFARHLFHKIPEGSTVRSQVYDTITDYPGDEAWMHGLDKKIKDYRIILVFFDVSKFTQDSKYQLDTNARIDFVYQNATLNQGILLIATHADLASGDYTSTVSQCFANKNFKDLKDRIVYVDMREEKSKDTIMKEVKKLIKG